MAYFKRYHADKHKDAPLVLTDYANLCAFIFEFQGRKSVFGKMVPGTAGETFETIIVHMIHTLIKLNFLTLTDVQ